MNKFRRLTLLAIVAGGLSLSALKARAEDFPPTPIPDPDNAAQPIQDELLGIITGMQAGWTI